MVAAEVKQEIETYPGHRVWRVEADDGETVEAPFGVEGATFQPNRDSAASDSWGVTFTAGETQITINLTGTTTNVTGTLEAWGA